LAMSAEEGANLLDRLRDKNARMRPRVYGDLVMDLVPSSSASPFIFNYRPLALFLWEDRSKTRFITALGNVVPGARPLPGVPIAKNLIANLPAQQSHAPAMSAAPATVADVACPAGLPADADRTRCADQVKVMTNGLYWGVDRRIHSVAVAPAQPAASSARPAMPVVPSDAKSNLEPKPLEKIKP